MRIETKPITDKATWLEWRRQDITASDIGAICGRSPYKTALMIWAEKAGEVEPEENAAMRAGRWLEDAVIAAMKDKHPTWQIIKPSLYYRAPELRLGATPDALAVDEHGRRVNIQCKTVGRSQFEKWEGVPPLGYQLQVATEAMLMEIDYSILAVLTRSEWECELHEYRIDRHARAEGQVLDMVAKFWDSVGKGETPAVDFARDLQLVKKLKPPRAELEALDFSNDNHLPVILAERERLKANIKEDEERIKKIDAETIAKLNGHPFAK